MADPGRLVVAMLVSWIGSAMGCAPSEAMPASAALPPTTEAPADPAVAGAPRATFRVLNHLAWPFRLARVQIAADGAVLKQQEVAADREPPASITASVAVTPGPHVFQLLASARVKLTAVGPDCTVTLRSATAFVAEGAAPADVKADLYLRDRTRRFEERLDVRTRLSGVQADMGLGRRLPAAAEARCRELRAPDRAVCRVEAMVAEAVRERDVVRLICDRDKLDQMRVLARMRDEAWAQAEAIRAGDPARRAPRRSPSIVWDEASAPPTDTRLDEAEYHDRVLVLERQIEALGNEAEQCVGEDRADPAGPRLTVDECFATGAPEIDLDPIGPRLPGVAQPAPIPWAP